VRSIAPLDHLADGRHPGGAQELLELGQVFGLAGRHRRDHVRTLTRATAGLVAVGLWPAVALGGC
jgi:hypothetical protein